MRSYCQFLVLVLIVAMLGLGLERRAEARQSEDTKKAGVRYAVDLSDAKNHYVTISATIPVRDETTELMMAVWTPGSYLIREYARHIDSMEITSGGKKLEYEKTRKNRWVVQTKDVESFRLRYRLYCNEMTVRTNFAGNQYAMINGAPTFVTVADRLDEKHVVRLKLPKAWKRSATSLESTGKQPHIFVANNFDELVDSPIVAGNVQVYPFTAGGIEHQLVNVGESGQWDGTKAAADLKQVVEAHQEMWDAIPYDRYLFINMISEAGGGLEHDFSTLIMTSRWSFRDKRRYQDWLSLASHEFFHTWNVRRLRPKSLVRYDYETEVYTDVLWIAEGITSYYEDLALVRAGLINRNDFLARLSKNVETVQRTNGRKVQSLRDSSYDTWIKFYRPDENSSNTRISYYSKGAVVAFLLDAKIRKLTDGQKNLDDVMRKMWATHAQTGFTSKDFRKVVSEVAGEDLTDWFVSAVDSTEELDYSDLEYLGIKEPNKKEPNKSTQLASAKVAEPKASQPNSKTVTKDDQGSAQQQVQESKESMEGSAKEEEQEEKKETDKQAEKQETKREKRIRKRKEKRLKAQQKEAAKQEKKRAAAQETSETDEGTDAKPVIKPAVKPTLLIAKPAVKPALPARPVFKPAPVPWLGITTSSGKVSRVSPDSPAADVGLSIGDEIIAIDGYRASRGVETQLSRYEVGQEVELLISRREQMMTIRVELGQLVYENWRLKFITKPSDQQKKQMDLWLGEAK